MCLNLVCLGSGSKNTQKDHVLDLVLSAQTQLVCFSGDKTGCLLEETWRTNPLTYLKPKTDVLLNLTGE